MTIYWSLKQVPELAGLSPSERGRVYRACLGKVYKSPRCVGAMLICILCSVLGFSLGFESLHLGIEGLHLTHLLLAPAIGGGIGGGIGGVISSQIRLEYLRPFFADYIQKELRPDVA